MLDLYQVGELFTEEERQIQTTARQFMEAEALPHIQEWWEEASFPEHLATRFGDMGFLGATLPVEYGGAGLGSVAYGLIAYELERVDSGLRSFMSVAALTTYPIYAFGSEEQKRRYLPELCAGRLVGCFGLTEHEGGSDPGAMKTRAHKVGKDYVLNGVKMWITDGNIAHIAVVWAKDDEGEVRGFIVPTDTPGFKANLIKHKMSQRASVTSELVLDDVRLPASQMLPNAKGLRPVFTTLTQARYGLCWGSLGALEMVYTEALAFAQKRITFGKPIASRQLVQAKLADMLSDHTRGLLLAWRLGQLKDAGTATPAQISVAKRGNVLSALKAARTAREILGGSGITLEYHAIRHMLNLEAVHTLEGTYDIHTLVIGREVTGHNAF